MCSGIAVLSCHWALLESPAKQGSVHKYVQKMTTNFNRWEQDSSDILNPEFRGIVDGEFEINGIMFDSSIQSQVSGS